MKASRKIKTNISKIEQMYRGQTAKMMITLAIWMAIYVVAIVGGYSFFSMFSWSYESTIYQFAKTLESNYIIAFIIYMLAGYFLISRYYLKKAYGYLDEIVEATEKLFQDDDQLIEISQPMKPVENRLNHIKMTNTKNQRAARVAEQRKNDLVAYLAHDLKTPITSIIGYLTLLADEPDISAEKRARYTGISLDKAERLDELINEFFDITRFNLSEIELEIGEINISMLLNQLVFEFQPMLDAKNLECRTDIEEKIMLQCDGNKMQRVFENLLRNAVNYSYDNTEIQIEAKADWEKISIGFINKGATIPRDKLNRLFEQFYRLDSSRSTRSGGSGLGLAIAKEIVELHNGTIEAESHDNIISFMVTFPIQS